ncbi:MogA/MoaB family molybdenum cofactor biosynthesis protein [Halegenticoccus soli]|uniref:MogA/MoaB family molybdenum cofactor biosynthesis protein n=1 Tax=Halegenticoccus soli TaxID=1985678 RepID=UPI000C6E968F|nr:molybdenum cofactor biosynthesis protein B [Halegenticoccus soli]
MSDEDARPLAGRDEFELEGDHGSDEEAKAGEGHDRGQGDEREHGHGGDAGHEHEHEHEHEHHRHDVEDLGVAVVTISSTRSLKDDPAGDAIVAAFETDGGDVVTRELIRDDYDGVQSAVDNLVGRDDVDAVVTTGGTGVTPDDVTVEAVRPLFEKELPGFGELFRRLSYDEIGTRVVGTRAVAGVADGVLVFCLPGSENAARLGAEEIVVKEASHLAGLAARDDDEDGDGEENGAE